MTPRENIISLFRKEGYEFIQPEFSLCPSLEETYRRETGASCSYQDYFDMPWRNVDDIALPSPSAEAFRRFYRTPYQEPLKADAEVDNWGVGHEKGSAEAYHTTYMRHPLAGYDDPAVLADYPFPRFDLGDAANQKPQADAIHKRGLAAMGNMQMTIWETAWYIRSMEELMMDMMDDSPMAESLLDIIAAQSVVRAQSFARAGVDLLYLGDDIGTQRGPMMSIGLYRRWIYPRLRTVIDAARAVSPDIIIMYHSCGLVAPPFIEAFIEAGVDVLNPIQSECMDYRKVVARYGSRLSFHGCLGTQTVFPSATPAQVAAATREALDIAGAAGGLLAAPTHVLEPEVPWENIVAYVEACRNYRRGS
jgi:uroporphyrinogen decarboxylase